MNDSRNDHLDTVLAASHWLASLCVRWEELEAERLSRKILRELDGPDPRPLPVASA